MLASGKFSCENPPFLGEKNRGSKLKREINFHFISLLQLLAHWSAVRSVATHEFGENYREKGVAETEAAQSFIFFVRIKCFTPRKNELLLKLSEFWVLDCIRPFHIHVIFFTNFDVSPISASHRDAFERKRNLIRCRVYELNFPLFSPEIGKFFFTILCANPIWN